MELFLHPWYMVAGGALISSPIIIHLINRMRFKRIRWAAMEFLLKSQKRNRRRLIIEQMILLLLRILLVLLVAFLVARFVGGALANTGQGTTHVVILDDTLSMSDPVRTGEMGTPELDGSRAAMDAAKLQVQMVARNAVQASSAQYLTVYQLSDLNTPIFNDRLNERSVQELAGKLNKVQATPLHIDPVRGIKKGRAALVAAPQGNKILHLIGDFRDCDWGASDRLEELNKELADLLDRGINLSLIDSACPSRKFNKGAPPNENLAIVDFRANSRIAAEYMPVEFTVTLRNFGSTEVSNCELEIFRNNREYNELSPMKGIRLPGGEKKEIQFKIPFIKEKPTPEFIPVRVQLKEKNPKGLAADNTRDLVVEIRKKIPVLLVDGAGEKGFKETGGDAFNLEAAIYTERAFDTKVIGPEQLADLKPAFETYPCLFLLNVEEIKNEDLLKRLKDYVENGGSVAYFMGDKAKVGFYNELFRKYNGLFPVLLDSMLPAPSKEEMEALEKNRREDPQPKILFRNEKHPVLLNEQGGPGELVKKNGDLSVLLIARYFRTQPRSQWLPEQDKDKPEEIITLPNRSDIGNYKQRVQDLVRNAVSSTTKLGDADPEYKKYVRVVENYQRVVVRELGRDAGAFYYTVAALDAMLLDPGEKDKPDRPDMPKLWSHPSMAPIRRQLEQLKDNLQYGDPLVVSRTYGRGRVAVCLTTAGVKSRWNDWADGPATWSYVIFVKQMLRYLNSENADLNRLVTDEAGLRLSFEGTPFKQQVTQVFQPQPGPDGRTPDPKKETITLGLSKDGDKDLQVFKFDKAREPGVYTFQFMSPLEDTKTLETRSYAFNVDTSRESDLKRTNEERLTNRGKSKDAKRGKVVFLAAGDPFEQFKQREPDTSESPWLYLLFLIVLVVEQALAVHLSFHVNPNEAAAPVRSSQRPAPAAA